FTADVLRSLILVVISAGLLWAYHKEKLAKNIALIGIGILMVGDLFFVAKNYVNEDSFVESYKMQEPFQATPLDKMILEDTSHFRVFELQGAMSNARTSYFHKSIGGYSAVKPKRIQELYDYQITQGNQEILNMLNVKYVIDSDEQGNPVPMLNGNAYGNAWFVNQVEAVNSSDEEMKALDSLDKNTAILSLKDFTHLSKEIGGKTYETDSLSSIQLTEYKPNYLKYQSSNVNDGLAVFSEIYYPKGWVATIDGNEAEIFRVNYTLRALQIPKGNHTIEFRFEPEVVAKGSTIALVSSLGMLLLIGLGLYFETKKKNTD